MNGPVVGKHRQRASPSPLTPPPGPIIGGFVYQYLGWRWISWIVLILTGIAVVLTFLSKETYAPAILRKLAAQKRKETGDARWWCRYDEKIQFWPLLKLNLGRPFVMMLTEPIW
jgi:MFS family permease